MLSFSCVQEFSQKHSAACAQRSTLRLSQEAIKFIQHAVQVNPEVAPRQVVEAWHDHLGADIPHSFLNGVIVFDKCDTPKKVLL